MHIQQNKELFHAAMKVIQKQQPKINTWTYTHVKSNYS